MNGIPEKIGRYTVERLLGQGAMGSVYLGRDPDLDRAVAIKTVRDLDLEEDRRNTFLDRFRNEARAAARLSHPAIVAVYDVGDDEEVGPYLVFEYVAGSTLKQILRGRGPLAPDAAARLARQIAAALDTAHAAGVIHRDIKPDNILISATGDAKLADFGIARVPDAALTKEGQFLGTPCYAAPETLEAGRYGAHSDLFSFAAVLYEAISGTRAFPGDDAITVAHAVVHDDPPPLSEAAPEVRVPRSVERAVMKGLSKESSARQASATQLVDELVSAYVDSGLLDRDPTGAQVLPSPEAERRAKGSSWVFGGVLGLLAVVGLGFVAAYVGGRDGGSADPPLIEPALQAPDGGPDAHVARVDGAARSTIVVGLSDAQPREAGAAADAGTTAAEASGVPDVEQMDTFEREEAAKDEVSRARRALGDGDLDEAESALERAAIYDPGNADIPTLRSRLGEARGGGHAPVP